ncbi:MAG: septum formation initiator family protein [Patescibacteria group bacterium]
MVKKILITLILVFLFSSLIKNISEYRKNLSFYATYKKNYEDEKNRNNKLKMQSIKENDPAELEKTIRNKLNLKKPNEVAIIVPTLTPFPMTPTPSPMPIYQQWVKVFTK